MIVDQSNIEHFNINQIYDAIDKLNDKIIVDLDEECDEEYDEEDRSVITIKYNAKRGRDVLDEFV